MVMITSHTSASRSWGAALILGTFIMVIIAIKAKSDDVLLTGTSSFDYYIHADKIKIGADESCINNVCYPAGNLPTQFACLNVKESSGWQTFGIIVLVALACLGCANTRYANNALWIVTMLGCGFGGFVCFVTWLTSVYVSCMQDRDPKTKLDVGFTTAAWGYMCLACGGLFGGWVTLACMLKHNVITPPQYTPVPAAADPVSAHILEGAPACGVVVQ